DGGRDQHQDPGDHDVDATFVPSGPMANHIPPWPSPVVSPGFWSGAYRYSGQPASVICLVPSDRVTSPTRPLPTPSTATEPSSADTGSQVRAHSPSQVARDGLAVSWLYM